MLEDAGWTEGKDWLNEVELPGMPKKSEILSVTNFCEDKENFNARCVFSTDQTMMNCIDTVKDEKKLFTVWYFDLVIVDRVFKIHKLK